MTEWIVRRTRLGGDAGPREWRLDARREASAAPAGMALHVRLDAGSGPPRYWFRLGTVIHCAPELGVAHRHRTLTLCSDLADAAELDFRGAAAAGGDPTSALLEAAMRWLALEPAPPRRVYCEVAARDDAAAAGSPFFEALGQHFLPSPPGMPAGPRVPEAGQPFGAMLPRHPIYATLLPAAAQAAIGQAAPALAGRVAALVGEGFAEGQTVRVTDGGPVFEAPMQASATARAGASGWAAGADADELRRVPIRR